MTAAEKSALLAFAEASLHALGKEGLLYHRSGHVHAKPEAYVRLASLLEEFTRETLDDCKHAEKNTRSLVTSLADKANRVTRLEATLRALRVLLVQDSVLPIGVLLLLIDGTLGELQETKKETAP